MCFPSLGALRYNQSVRYPMGDSPYKLKTAMNFKSIYNWYRQGLINPKYRWWMVLGTLLYFLSPLDLSPDLIPIVGQIDDLILLTFLFTQVGNLVGNYFQSQQQIPVPNHEEEVNQTIDVDAISVD